MNFKQANERGAPSGTGDETIPLLIVIMGTSGCGKTTFGKELSKVLGLPFIDGDDLHPQSNIAKMSSGQPLTDADRLPWLLKVREESKRICYDEIRSFEMTSVNGLKGARMEADLITHRSQSEKDFMNALIQQDHRPALVLGCSSLKRVYRDILRSQAHPEENEHPPRPLETIFVYLYGTFEVLSERMNHRTGHYMHQDMLKSQFADLEDPRNTEEDGIIAISLDQQLTEQVRQASKQLKNHMQCKTT